MSDESETPVLPLPPPEPPTGAYSAFHEKLVFVQLRVEMIGVTYPNSPVLNTEGNPIGTKMLRGQCVLHPGEDIIEMRTLDPVHPNLMAVVLIPRDLIAYMSRIEPMANQPGYSR